MLTMLVRFRRASQNLGPTCRRCREFYRICHQIAPLSLRFARSMGAPAHPARSMGVLARAALRSPTAPAKARFARSMGALARAALRSPTAPAKARFARSMGVLARAALRSPTAPA
ncbi:MAG: hypothetical protein KDB14_15135, partial [Planctomycetales bacterium]|nr:hypothetical protein [Planctomycetales bacterium]